MLKLRLKNKNSATNWMLNHDHKPQELHSDPLRERRSEQLEFLEEDTEAWNDLSDQEEEEEEEEEEQDSKHSPHHLKLIPPSYNTSPPPSSSSKLQSSHPSQSHPNHSSSSHQPSTTTHQDYQNHPDSSSSSSLHRKRSQSSVQLDHLITDPASILIQLKLQLEPQTESPISSRPSSNPNNSIGSLPWQAVIPQDLIPSRPTASINHHHLQSSPTPSSSTDSYPTPSNYHPLPASPDRSKELSPEFKRQIKFIDCLDQSSVDIPSLRKLSWSGIPSRLRALVWQILLGYLPAPKSRRIEVLARKRQEYQDAVRLAFGKGPDHLDQSIWHQIQIDVARTNPGVPLWQFPATQRSLERILYVWAIRHPASGYVQGINDLVTPFFQVFLTAYIDSTAEVESHDVSNLPAQALEAIEADSFWSVSKLLEGIQDNYIFAQPGIQRQVARLKELCERVDARLHKHLEDEKVEFIQFAFRWINCLLMRELSTKKIIRMWDTYLAEGTAAFSEFHLYVCLAFLVKYSDQLRSMDFQSIIIFLQALPTDQLTEKDLELLLSQAFMWHSLFQGATGHFVRK